MKEFIDKLIERLEEYIETAKAEGDYTYIEPFEIAKNTVNQLAEEYNDGWIPVSSGRLPEEGVAVEVTVKEDNDNGGYDLYVFESWYQEGSWVISKNRYNPTVIAWKPKDSPYQPKVECNKKVSTCADCENAPCELTPPVQPKGE